ncbi:MAG: hypothetical protein CMJ25_27775 [Phycisphaerae bacterium]|nr:hypothetical protein [Phycisphaerae bacterium]|tara:strand:+ start:438 stop:722 length:285 start_codon:yes stop_codon:yes gene_type:complete
MSELKKLRHAFSKILAKEGKLLKIMGAEGGDTLKNETKLEELRGRKKETLASLAEAEMEAADKKVKPRRSGGAGGRMMMPQEYSKRTLYKPKTN